MLKYLLNTPGITKLSYIYGMKFFKNVLFELCIQWILRQKNVQVGLNRFQQRYCKTLSVISYYLLPLAVIDIFT